MIRDSAPVLHNCGELKSVEEILTRLTNLASSSSLKVRRRSAGS